jgi:AcrR family transcriptional regulator
MGGVDLPPYAQIAAELRDQIENGTLAPGDRVPSTREITQRWGVAMATATKALAALRQEGIVRPVPGVGTVVVAGRQPARGRPLALAPPAPPPGPAAGRRGPSDRRLAPGRIVAAAMAVADAEGLAGLSMRRVATEIGVATMSLYRHVADKDDLLLKMMDAAFGECRFPARRPEGWREQLELAARTLWAMFQRHPWLAPALSVTRPQPIASGLTCAEWVLTALDGRGLDPSTMLTIHITLVNYVRGTAVNLELEADAEAASGLNSEEWLDTQGPAMRSIVETGHFPVFGRLTATDYDFNLDNLFEFGLQRLLDGLTALIDSRPRPGAG